MTWATWLEVEGKKEVLLWNWIIFCFSFELCSGCRYRFPSPSRCPAERWLTPVSQILSLKLWRRWAGKQSESDSIGSGKENTSCPWTKELEWGCMWEVGWGISLSRCSCSWISLNSSFSFSSLFLILSLSALVDYFSLQFLSHIFPLSLPPSLALTFSLSCFLATV